MPSAERTRLSRWPMPGTRVVWQNPIVSHAFSHGFHPHHSERLAAYWAEALGGPADYTQLIGKEPGVVRPHSGKGEHLEMDEQSSGMFRPSL